MATTHQSDWRTQERLLILIWSLHSEWRVLVYESYDFSQFTLTTVFVHSDCRPWITQESVKNGRRAVSGFETVVSRGPARERHRHERRYSADQSPLYRTDNAVRSTGIPVFPEE
jgi:hypothetical protein